MTLAPAIIATINAEIVALRRALEAEAARKTSQEKELAATEPSTSPSSGDDTTAGNTATNSGIDKTADF